MANIQWPVSSRQWPAKLQSCMGSLSRSVPAPQEGRADSKLRVPNQVTHDVGVSWIFENDVARTTATLEIQNVTDALLYDNFGVQRPGRAFYAKLAATFR